MKKGPGPEAHSRPAPWEQPSLPPLPAGHVRVMALTPGGPRFGQGPGPALTAGPLAATFPNAATALLQLLTGQAT